MNKIHANNFYEMFSSKKEEVIYQVNNIYKQIADTITTQYPECIAQTILQEESQKINDYIIILRQELKNNACTLMTSCGLSKAVAEIVWATVMRSVSLPRVSLCKKQDVKISDNTHEQPNKFIKEEAELKRLETTKKVCIVGTTVGIITCLIIPGWTGLAVIGKAAGFIVACAGTVGTVVSQQQIKEINRIVNRYSNETSQQTDIYEVIKNICKHQSGVNSKIICDWIDKLYDELIKQCEIELER